MPKAYVPNDKWSQKAAKEGYRARSVYKLMELDERFALLRPGITVLDLGAAPGSWLQYAAKKIGDKGKAIGIDLQPIAPIKGVKTYRGDVLDPAAVADVLAKENIEHVDLLLSDLAPSTTGIRDVDQWKSIELSQSVAALATKLLAPGGWCVMKVLRGADFDEFLCELKRGWQEVKIARVKATRDRSNEVYVVLN